eukprot:TRINITY_DN2783_c0_g1_i1.p1 TRINITY_DN2783_c0_g1~~TRINITY_DN2783_c0_g1_i1.p1  ORF type:complete len:332 (-),score=74.19 TRINITY_DN2783_c0_g1_i1:14-934(-)
MRNINHTTRSNPVPTQMMIQLSSTEHTGYFKNKDSIYIHYRISEPSQDIQSKGVVLWFHGFTGNSDDLESRTYKEHINREGYVFAALDHQGMGKSGGNRGHVVDYQDFLDDGHTFLNRVKEMYPSMPLFLSGESLGGALSVAFANRYQSNFEGMVLFGSAVKIDEETISPWKYYVLEFFVELLPKLALGSGVDNPEGMTRVREVSHLGKEDPLYFDTCTLSFGKNFLLLQQDAMSHLQDITIPVLLIHGLDDGVIPHTATDDISNGISSIDKTVLKYEGLRHSFYKDPLEEEIFGEIINWMNSKIN